MTGSIAQRIRRVVVAVALAGASVLALPAVAANAAGTQSAGGHGTNLHCQITITLNVTPAATFTMQDLAVYSDGVTGTGPCTGTARGKAPTGAASFGTITAQRANCIEGTGFGAFLLEVPVAGSTETFFGTYTLVSTLDGSTISGDLSGSALGIDYVEGGGDCIDTPLTRYIAFFDVTLTQ